MKQLVRARSNSADPSCRILALRSAMQRFSREEDGSLIIFGLFAFVMMLLLAGISLDLMRFEERRTRLQATVDRASLAAADRQQTLPPKEVVKDYFRKAGLKPPADNEIIVTEGAYGEFRRVQVNTSEQMPTWFMTLVGVDELSTPAASVAEESIGQIEISLILDISGSMGSNQRLVNLKPAAKQFVDQMFDGTEGGKVSISIVPYSTQVAMSDELASYFNLSSEHSYSNCIEFTSGDFTRTSLDFGTNPGDRVYQRNGHFDPFYKSRPTTLLNCRNTSSAEILPFGGNRDALKAHIDGLSAAGNTSIDIGMKWGAALLDPSMAGVVDGMIDANKLPVEFSDRPYPFDTEGGNGESVKVIVLMTDGQNTTEYRLDDNFSGKPGGVDSRLYSNTWYQSNQPGDKRQYSYYDPNRSSSNKYYSFHTQSWLAEPFGDNSGDLGDAVPMTWPEVWNDMSIRYFADNIVYDATGSSSQRNYFRNAPYNGYSSTKDSTVTAMCDLAKSKKVRIYTISFEAPTSGQQLLQNCATTTSHHFAVSGASGISDAFFNIATSINKLRLTQ